MKDPRFNPKADPVKNGQALDIDPEWEPSADERADAANLGHSPTLCALAKRMDVDLAVVTPGGPDGLVTADDVQRVASVSRDVQRRVAVGVGPLRDRRAELTQDYQPALRLRQCTP